MGKLIVDQIQKPGGSTFTLPTTAAAGSLVSDVSGNLSITAAPVAARVAPTELHAIGMVVTSSAHANVYGSTGFWSSDGPGGIYNARYVGGTVEANSTTAAWNMLMGDGVPTGTTDRLYAYNRNGDIYRQVYYANNKRLGHMRQMQYYDRDVSDDYTGITMSVLPVRNTTAASLTKTVNFYTSNDFSSYGGAALGIYTPTTGLYSAVVGGAWTQGYTVQSSSNLTAGSAAIVIPANTTVLLLLATTHNYQTTYKYMDTHYYFNLDTIIDGSNVVCDMRMLEVLRTNRSFNATTTVINMPAYYQQCATQYGDR